MRVSSTLSFSALLLMAATAPPLCADATATTAESADPAETVPLWEWSLAAFTRYGASYPGSDESQFNFVPLPFPKYRGKFLRVGDETENPIRGRIFRRDRIKLDIDFDLNFSSDSDDIDARTGMPDLDFLLEVGPELELQFAERSPLAGADLFLGLQLRAATSWDGVDPSFQGLIFSPELKWRKKLSRERRSELKFRITPGFATDDYMDYFYGVEPQFVTPDRPAFDAKGGYLGTDFTLSLRQALGKRYEIYAGVRLSALSGAKNEDSPLFKDDFNTAVIAAFLWKFWESDRRVPADED